MARRVPPDDTADDLEIDAYHYSLLARLTERPQDSRNGRIILDRLRDRDRLPYRVSERYRIEVDGTVTELPVERDRTVAPFERKRP